jgi:hypothetical protein
MILFIASRSDEGAKLGERQERQDERRDEPIVPPGKQLHGALRR